jgi:hypothetical protein
MGLFGDLDVASAPEIESGIKPGAYNAKVLSVVMQEGSKNNPDKNFLVFEYESPQWPFSLSEYKEIPKGSPGAWDRTVSDAKGRTEFERNTSAMSYIKARLLSLGVPESRVNTVDPSELVGLNVIVKVKQNGEYSNITSVTVPQASGVTLPTGNTGAAPVASAPAAGVNPFGG